MTLVQFFRLINKNINLLLLCSLALACTVFFFTYGLPETYQVRTEIYTGLASGTSVESVTGGGVDWRSTNNQFDNLINVVKSEQTLAEVGEKLFVKHLALEGPGDEKIGEEAWEKFSSKVTQELKDSIYVEGSEEQTLKNIQDLKANHYGSFLIKQLFQSPASPYSPAGIGANLSIKRIGNSDLVDISNSWTDPGICQQTMIILNDVFKQKLLEIRIGQSNDVVDYFQKKAEDARRDLEAAEDSLKNFRIKHKIINYEQQTQNIASLQNNLEQEYQKELRVQAAAKSSVKQMERKLEHNQKMVEFSDELLTKRKRLSDINSKIAELEVYYNDEGRLSKLRNEAEKLEAELSNNLSKRYEFSRTKEGVSNKAILQEWLDATIALDASNARLNVLSNRESFFQNAYDEFSPLGSQLGRLVRTVDVAEKKYLALNGSLNSALTKQQSQSLSTGGLVVTVPPKFPLEPVKSKRLLLVLVSAVVGFLVPFALMFIIEFLDNTIKTVERGEEKTGLKLLGAYPSLNLDSQHRNVDLGWLRSKSMSHVLQNIRYEVHRVGSSGVLTNPFSLLVFSIRDGEGKSFLAHRMASEVADFNKKVLLLSSEEQVVENEEDKPSYTFVQYQIDQEFLMATDLEAHLKKYQVNLKDFEYVFMDFEAVLTEPYPIQLIENFDMPVCVVSSKRAWNKADMFALNEFTSVLSVKPRLLLNGVEPDYMDSVLGEIKKTRSPIRKFIKAILTLEFRTRRGKRL
ncbi:GumC family protein [Owenweeksia hongkongensis]|uniref:GumC family protein n=1 Tax=Owenweeksia hongkongensis TaxID=253245 RepID=UPI003A9351ED